MRVCLLVLYVFSCLKNSAQGNKIIDRDSFYLEYPATWKVDTKSNEYEADSSFTIYAPGKLNNIMFFLKHKAINSEQVMNFFSDITLSVRKIKKPEFNSFNNWGNFSGMGRIIRGKSRGKEIMVVIFIHSQKNHSFLVMEHYIEGHVEHLRKEFNTISTSFRFKN